MHIEITGETEQLIQAAVASGQFASVEALLAEMAKRLQTATSAPEGRLPKDIDIDDLAARQGVGPITDFRDLKADFWPKDESVDDFLQEIRALRDHDSPRMR